LPFSERLASAIIARGLAWKFVIHPVSLLAHLSLKRPRNADLAVFWRDALAGVISAVLQIAYCISFSALIFQGSIVAGYSLGLAAMIMGTAVAGMVIALTSTLVAGKWRT
jgi:hypothetical protein